MKKTDELQIVLRSSTDNLLTVYVDVYDNSLSKKWLDALNNLLERNYHLEKNFCFLGFLSSNRSAQYLLQSINNTIGEITKSDLDYTIDDYFSLENTIDSNGRLIQDKLNNLHRYFEDLQGVSNNLSTFYTVSTPHIKWHIRQLNLLCHEYESMVKSMRQVRVAPANYRPSQLMCWLNAPRYMLDETDYELFGIETLARSFGGVYVGVNKAIGKDHWEVFQDEGQFNKQINELTTTTLRPQSEAAGDFDIEWGSRVGQDASQQKQFKDFAAWLTNNGLDPSDKSLTIGHPKIGQVDLLRSFGTTEGKAIRDTLSKHLDVYSIETSMQRQTYNYNWADVDYMEQQVRILNDNNPY